MSRLLDAFEQLFDGSGDPLVDGTIDFFESGSSSVRKDTFSDSGETVANSNPVVLNGDGRAPDVFGTGTYRAILKTAAGVQILQRDPVGGDLTLTFGSDWVSSQTYGATDVVREDGLYWESLTSGNIDNRPSLDAGSNWAEIDFTPYGTDWLAARTYEKTDVVRLGGIYFLSLISSNKNNSPDSSVAEWEEIQFNRIWNSTVAYSIGNNVIASDGHQFISLTNSNTGNDPITSPANWKEQGQDNINESFLINGDAVIDARGISTAINDDTYAWDRWIILSDGNGVVTPSQTTDVPIGARSAGKLTVAIANKKFGLLQIVEGKNSKIIIDSIASLSASAKSSTLSNLRVAILSWTGTEDSVTSDVVSSWNASGTDPTLVANWTYENTPANISLSTSWNTGFDALNVSINTASTKQVAVFIWIDDTDASVSDTLSVTNVKLEKGPIATDYPFRFISEELADSQRYYTETITVREMAPLAATGSNANFRMYQWSYPAQMRTTPTIVAAVSSGTINVLQTTALGTTIRSNVGDTTTLVKVNAGATAESEL